MQTSISTLHGGHTQGAGPPGRGVETALAESERRQTRENLERYAALSVAIRPRPLLTRLAGKVLQGSGPWCHGCYNSDRATAQGLAPPARSYMGGLLNKIFLVDLFQGLWVTFRNQNPKYIYTEQYPTERPKVAERYRGAPRLNINPDTNETLCISCNLCALACPENLIVVTSVRNEQTRRKELTEFTYDLSRCMFCGLCEDACPVDALELTQDFELASYTREGGIWDRQMLEEGPRPTQYK